jgi:hypothetical protein
MLSSHAGVFSLNESLSLAWRPGSHALAPGRGIRAAGNHGRRSWHRNPDTFSDISLPRRSRDRPFSSCRPAGQFPTDLFTLLRFEPRTGLLLNQGLMTQAGSLMLTRMGSTISRISPFGALVGEGKDTAAEMGR